MRTFFLNNVSLGEKFASFNVRRNQSGTFSLTEKVFIKKIIKRHFSIRTNRLFATINI